MDDDVAKVWEDSQLAEATRASKAAEREREELDRAMQLSLQEAQKQARPGSQDASGAGPSRPHLGGPIASDSTLRNGMARLSIPSTSTQPISLIDGLEDIDFSDPPLQPTHGPLKSNNPFLSSDERETMFAEEREHARRLREVQPPPDAGSQSAPKPPSIGNLPGRAKPLPHPPKDPTLMSATKASPPGQALGTPHQTQFEPPHGPPSPHLVIKSPPAISHQIQYNPPPGPPPPHLVIRSPPTLSSLAVAVPSPSQADDPSLRMPDPMHYIKSPISPAGRPHLPNGGSSSSGEPGGSTSAYIDPPPLPPRKATPQELRPPEIAPTAGVVSIPQPNFPGQNTAAASHLPNRLAPATSSSNPSSPSEDALEMLRDYNTIFLVDDSSSMAAEHWVTAKQALLDMAETAARYEDDGVSVYFVNSKRIGREIKTADDVEDLFGGLNPKGATP